MAPVRARALCQVFLHRLTTAGETFFTSVRVHGREIRPKEKRRGNLARARAGPVIAPSFYRCPFASAATYTPGDDLIAGETVHCIGN